MKDFFEPTLPPGWKWISSWTVDKSQFVNIDGWAYGPDFQTLKWPPNSSKCSTKSAHNTVRRRRWTRTRQQVKERGANNTDHIVTSPGSSAILPWRCMSKDSNHCLQVRPRLDYSQTPYSWGHPIAVGSVFGLGKDQTSIESSALSRQNTARQGNKIPISALKLNQLEKMDLLLCCPGGSGKQLWLCVGTDASVLHTELNAPVYDWKLSISSPLKLENRLPCGADFTIWEKLKDGNTVERHRGFMSSRETVHIYSADVRNPIYLMLFVQGGWVMEKVVVPGVNICIFMLLDIIWVSHTDTHMYIAFLHCKKRFLFVDLL